MSDEELANRETFAEQLKTKVDEVCTNPRVGLVVLLCIESDPRDETKSVLSYTHNSVDDSISVLHRINQASASVLVSMQLGHDVEIKPYTVQ